VTRIAILADIHGNLPALQAVWNDLEQFEVDQVVVAGDVVNWGPFSLEVLEFLAARHCTMMRGNNEIYVLDYQSDRAPAAWASYTLPGWLHRQIGDGWRRRLAAWPDTLQLRFPDGPAIRVVHGSPRDHWEGIFPSSTDAEIVSMLEGVDEVVVVAGHTHLPLDRTSGKWRILNPGSVGIPLDGNPDASYMLLTARNGEWHAKHRRVAYDSAPLYAEFERQGFIEEHGLVGHLVVEEFRSSSIHLAAFLDWQAACCLHVQPTFGLLEHFTLAMRRNYAPAPYRTYI
jgi:predicted phosphodiesterase